MKILAFAGSNSDESINHKLINSIADLIQDNDVEILRLSDYIIPMYSIDIETDVGFPEDIIALDKKIKEADGLIISVAEHNGNVTAFFKSIIDWLSRYDRTFLKDKRIMLISTSPGQNGGNLAMAVTHMTLFYFRGVVTVSHSFGKFYSIYKNGRLVDKTAIRKAEEIVAIFLEKEHVVDDTSF